MTTPSLPIAVCATSENKTEPSLAVSPIPTYLEEEEQEEEEQEDQDEEEEETKKRAEEDAIPGLVDIHEPPEDPISDEIEGLLDRFFDLFEDTFPSSPLTTTEIKCSETDRYAMRGNRLMEQLFVQHPNGVEVPTLAWKELRRVSEPEMATARQIGLRRHLEAGTLELYTAQDALRLLANHALRLLANHVTAGDP